MSVLKKHHRAAHHGHYYECLVKFKGVAYNKVPYRVVMQVQLLRGTILGPCVSYLTLQVISMSHKMKD